MAKKLDTEARVTEKLINFEINLKFPNSKD